MQRNNTAHDTLREAYTALQAGRFAHARNTAARLPTPAGILLHALAAAAGGDLAAHATLAAIARANPAALHPALDLTDLLRRHGHDPVPHLRAALAATPGHPALLDHLGAALAETGPLDQAIATFSEATTRDPGRPAPWSNLGKALSAAGRHDDADQAHARATTLAPHDPQFALNQAIARLRAGRMAEAWPLFRARHRLPHRAPPPPGPELTTPQAAANQTVLLLHDEGFGDTIQFLRYAPLLQALGARVRIQAPPPLHRLLAAAGFDLAPGPYDAWCRIPDLPALFATTPATIPPPLPLIADPALVARRAAALPPGRRIGLVWAGAGRPHDPAAAVTDRQRSIAPDRLAPLLATPGVTWISLQPGLPPPPGVHAPGIADFADTAALIANLDAVVTVDTAAAHLAATLGTPVLLLDRFDHCWRWPAHGDTPWYPGRIQILRQPAPGDWDTVLRQAACTMMR